MTERLEVGQPAPAFTLPDADGRDVSLSDLKGRRVILYFYPAALTPGCTTQAIDFTAALEQLRAAGFDVLGVSPDTRDKLKRFAAKEGIGFPLLSDPDKTVHDAYGAFGTKMMYGKEVQGVIRSTFVVDVDDAGQGTVSVAQYNVRATGHVAKLQRDLGLPA